MKTTNYLLSGLALLIFLNCASDSGRLVRSEVSFKPPLWIQGTWFEIDDPRGLNFTIDDIISLDLDENNNIINEFSQKEFYSLFDVANVVESISDTIYKANVKLGGSTGLGNVIVNMRKRSTDTITSGTSLTYVRQ